VVLKQGDVSYGKAPSIVIPVVSALMSVPTSSSLHTARLRCSDRKKRQQSHHWIRADRSTSRIARDNNTELESHGRDWATRPHRRSVLGAGTFSCCRHPIVRTMLTSIWRRYAHRLTLAGNAYDCAVVAGSQRYLNTSAVREPASILVLVHV
jgi:hypothetical protein